MTVVITMPDGTPRILGTDESPELRRVKAERNALQSRIDTMLAMVETIRMEYLDDPEVRGAPTIEISRYGLSELLDSIKYAGGGQ